MQNNYIKLAKGVFFAQNIKQNQNTINNSQNQNKYKINKLVGGGLTSMGNLQSGNTTLSGSGSGFGNPDTFSTIEESERIYGSQWHIKQQQLQQPIIGEKEPSAYSHSTNSDDLFKSSGMPLGTNRVKFKDMPISRTDSSLSSQTNSIFSELNQSKLMTSSNSTNFSLNSSESKAVPFSPARIEDIYFPKAKKSSPIPTEEKSVSPLIRLAKDAQVRVNLHETHSPPATHTQTQPQTLHNFLASYDQYKLLNTESSPIRIE